VARRQAIKNHGLEKAILRHRVIFAAVVVVLALSAVLARLFHLQVVSHEHYITLSTNNRVRLEAIAPPRGMIYDRNGVLLADNQPSYILELTPAGVKDMDGTLARLGKVVEITDLDLRRFKRALRRSSSFQPVPLLFNLSDEDLARFAVERHNFPGVEIEARLGRSYPLSGTMAHVIGYVSRIDDRELARVDKTNYKASTHIGKIGLERQYEDLLHGKVGFQQVEVNAQGRRLRVLERQSPEAGKDLVLGLDSSLQAVAEAAMGGKSGSVVAIDPRNGDVLAMVSVPEYDPNLFVNGISSKDYSVLRDDPEQPLFNRSLTGQYPPGSTIKPLMGLAGLEYQVTWAGKTMYAGPYYMLKNDERKYRDWKKTGHGTVDLDKAITQSCDVYFYDLAFKLGIDHMHEFLDGFGLGKRTGIDSTGEASGLLPSREWKRRTRHQPWYPGETLIAGIGQGYMLATPLQLAMSTGAIAMRGKLMRPRLVKGVRDSRTGEVEALPPVQINQVELDNDVYWDQVIRPMVHVMTRRNGTGWWRAGRGAEYTIAGKTGTAQVFGIKQDEEYDAESLRRKLRDHALFVAFAPVEDPRIAVAVIVEHAGHGGAEAAPVARKIMDYYLLQRLDINNKSAAKEGT
jgi:penicillin-binding protein 2